VVCLLKAVEVRRWELHGQAPSRCSRRKHSHVSEEEARQMCSEGSARLSRINGRWCLLPLNAKKAYRPRISDSHWLCSL
jgi:hypothetical protein